jgi:hypothetical protein
VSSDVEERVHRALHSHPLERIEHGYRLVHPGGMGVSTLRLLPVNDAREGQRVLAIAEISAEYGSVDFPVFPPVGVQRLNSFAVHGAYRLEGGQLRQSAQYSIYSNETDPHLAAQSILNAFGGQLPLGRSAALATLSAAILRQQREHHKMPSQWKNPVDGDWMKAAANLLQERGMAASHDLTSVWMELPLSGEKAETALIRVGMSVLHPIAGTGYRASIALPLSEAPANSAQICEQLNALEMQQIDFVPRLGAWGLHGPKDIPGYSCFIPMPEPYPDLHLNVIWWCALRAAWVRDNFWAAGQGLTVESLTPGFEVSQQVAGVMGTAGHDMGD